MPDYFQWVGGPWPHGLSPAKAPITPAASLIQLRVKAVPLGEPNGGLAPAAALLQSVQLLPHSCRVLAVVTAFGAGGGRIPEVLSNGSVAAPGAGSITQARGEGRTLASVRSPDPETLVEHSYMSGTLVGISCEPHKASLGCPFYR